ncbi:molecular chaperone DnaJ [Salmonella enterica]|nr:molecular chaperone DnaJ [Salmonella enterica]
MTTITREQQKQILIDTANHVISRDNTSPYSENLRELARIALASLNATPIYQVQYGQQWRDVSKEVYEDHRDHGSSTRIVYAEPPASVTGIYDDVLNIIGLLENNEWAEHCTSTVLGSLLESEITRLVSKEQPAPVVPPAIEPDYKVIKSILPTATPDEYACCIAADMWNACRAAMLHGAEPVSQTYNLPELIEGMEVSIDVSTCDADAGNRYFGTVTEVSELYTAKNGYILLVQDAEPNFDVNGNSPVTPDGYALVPVEPTDEMIAAAMNCEDVLFNSDESFCVQFGNIYEAMLAAAPQK